LAPLGLKGLIVVICLLSVGILLEIKPLYIIVAIVAIETKSKLTTASNGLEELCVVIILVFR